MSDEPLWHQPPAPAPAPPPSPLWGDWRRPGEAADQPWTSAAPTFWPSADEPAPGQPPTGPASATEPPQGQAPYGQAPYGQAPYGQAPYGQAPYGQAPYGQAPYDQPPLGQPPLPADQSGPGTSGDPPRRRAGLLLVLALLASGGTGGAVTAAVMQHRNTAPLADNYVNQTGTGVTPVSAAPVGGTPEGAASIIGPSVVTVEVTGTQSGGFFGDIQQVSDTGSGVVLRSDGYILTNNHVVAAALSSGSVHVTFSDGRTVAATIVGHDTTSDLAVIKAVGVSKLRAAVFADSNKLVVGQSVLAVGAPLGLANTVTEGIVSTLHRAVATGEAGASSQSVIDAIQTDAAINPGNSGGALVDLGGRVVGINSAIASTGGSSGSQAGNIGVGFAIPSDDAARVADQLIATGHATHAQMGVSVGDAFSTTDGAPGPGATLRAVTPGGPADKGGLQAGDIVTKIGSRRVTDANSLIVAVRSYAPGATVPVEFTRGGSTRTASVTLVGVTSG